MKKLVLFLIPLLFVFGCKAKKETVAESKPLDVTNETSLSFDYTKSSDNQISIKAKPIFRPSSMVTVDILDRKTNLKINDIPLTFNANDSSDYKQFSIPVGSDIRLDDLIVSYQDETNTQYSWLQPKSSDPSVPLFNSAPENPPENLGSLQGVESLAGLSVTPVNDPAALANQLPTGVQANSSCALYRYSSHRWKSYWYGFWSYYTCSANTYFRRCGSPANSSGVRTSMQMNERTLHRISPIQTTSSQILQDKGWVAGWKRIQGARSIHSSDRMSTSTLTSGYF